MSKFIITQSETITTSTTEHVVYRVAAKSEDEAIALHNAGKSSECDRKTVVVHADVRFVGDFRIQPEQ